jgi:hypothetical protein
MKQKLIALGVLSSIAITQPGCLVGMATGNVVLTYVGIGLFLVGGSGGILVDRQGRAILTLGGLGVVLDEQNPGRQDVLNVLPMDAAVAAQLGVTLDDIAVYNDNLNAVRTVHTTLTQEIRAQIARLMSGEVTEENLATDAQLDALARKYGLGNAVELVETMRARTLPAQKVVAFAVATQLEPATAKILLQVGFGITISN